MLLPTPFPMLLNALLPTLLLLQLPLPLPLLLQMLLQTFPLSLSTIAIHLIAQQLMLLVKFAGLQQWKRLKLFQAHLSFF